MRENNEAKLICGYKENVPLHSTFTHPYPHPWASRIAEGAAQAGVRRRNRSIGDLASLD